MNLREGRVGKQEAAAAVAISCLSCGVFTFDAKTAFANGNGTYLASAGAAALSLLLFLLAAAAMKKANATDLASLYRTGFGAAFAGVFGFLTALLLVFSAAVPLARIIIVLSRYIFSNAQTANVAFYPLVCMSVVALMGLETIARTARLLFLLIALSFVMLILLAIPVYEGYRLYPLLGGNAGKTLYSAVQASTRFFSGLIALLICMRGAQGADSAAQSGKAGLIVAAVLTVLTQLCLGMTFPYAVLNGMHTPIYSMITILRSGNSHFRLDKLFLFLWMTGAMIGGAFLSYAAARLYAGCTAMRDVRPAALCFTALTATLALAANLSADLPVPLIRSLGEGAWIALVGLPLVAVAIVLMRQRKGRAA